MSAPEPDPPLRAGQALAASALLLWRLWSCPPAMLWRDWLLVLAVTWLVRSLRAKSPSGSTLTISAMAYLLGIYVAGQLPHTLIALALK